MKLVELNAGDVSSYRSLMLHAYEHAADAFTSTAKERALEPESWWVRRIADPSGQNVAFGTFEGEALMGSVALEYSSKPKTRHKALIIGMYVLPAFRRMGAARALLQAALQHAENRQGMRMLTLTVTEGNNAAVSLYEAAGFQTFGIEPMAILTPSGYRGKVHMWRPVGASATPS